MHVNRTSSLVFQSSNFVNYNNVPKELQASEDALSRIAKDHNLTLKITKSKDSKFLPKHDAYTVFAKKTDKIQNRIFFGVSMFLSQKNASNESIINAINKASQDAIFELISSISGVSTTPAESNNGFVAKTCRLFKKILKK